MTFQEYVSARRIEKLVEHLESLSEQQANRLIQSLDDQTVEMIETYMQEGMGEFIKKHRGKIAGGLVGIAALAGGTKLMGGKPETKKPQGIKQVNPKAPVNYTGASADDDDM